MRSASSVLALTAAVESRRESGAICRVRLRCLRPRSAMIRLPMLNVDSWFVGVRDDDEWAAQSAAPNALCWCRARKMCSAQRSRGITASAIESICLNQDAVGTKPSSVIPKRSTSVDAEECRAARARCFEHTLRGERCQRRSNLDHRVFADSSGAQAVSAPAGRAERTVGAPAESVDAAEHRVKIHNAMGERLQSSQGKRCDARSTTTSPSHCSGRSSAKRNGSRIQLSPCMCDRIPSRLLATFGVLKPSHDLGHAAGT